MKRFKELSAEWMKDPEYKAAYDALEEEFALASAVIEARIKSGLTQKEIAERMRTTQPFIARMEGGRQLPSVASLFRLAKATGLKLQISFV